MERIHLDGLIEGSGLLYVPRELCVDSCCEEVDLSDPHTSVMCLKTFGSKQSSCGPSHGRGGLFGN